MIRVVLLGSEKNTVIGMLEKQADMEVSVIKATTMDSIFGEIGNLALDIIVIDQPVNGLSSDILCHFLSQRYPDAQCLILLNGKPTFEMLQNSGFKARGYITAEQRSKIDKAVRVVHDGEAWLPRKLVADTLKCFTAALFGDKSAETHWVNG